MASQSWCHGWRSQEANPQLPLWVGFTAVSVAPPFLAKEQADTFVIANEEACMCRCIDLTKAFQ
jgi:hypothetical protein